MEHWAALAKEAALRISSVAATAIATGSIVSQSGQSPTRFQGLTENSQGSSLPSRALAGTAPGPILKACRGISGRGNSARSGGGDYSRGYEFNMASGGNRRPLHSLRLSAITLLESKSLHKATSCTYDDHWRAITISEGVDEGRQTLHLVCTQYHPFTIQHRYRTVLRRHHNPTTGVRSHRYSLQDAWCVRHRHRPYSAQLVV